MNASTIRDIRRKVAALMIAAVFALSAAYAPVLLDGVAGMAMVPSVQACSGSPGGC